LTASLVACAFAISVNFAMARQISPASFTNCWSAAFLAASWALASPAHAVTATTEAIKIPNLLMTILPFLVNRGDPCVGNACRAFMNPRVQIMCLPHHSLHRQHDWLPLSHDRCDRS